MKYVVLFLLTIWFCYKLIGIKNFGSLILGLSKISGNIFVKTYKIVFILIRILIERMKGLPAFIAKIYLGLNTIIFFQKINKERKYIGKKPFDMNIAIKEATITNQELKFFYKGVQVGSKKQGRIAKTFNLATIKISNVLSLSKAILTK